MDDLHKCITNTTVALLSTPILAPTNSVGELHATNILLILLFQNKRNAAEKKRYYWILVTNQNICYKEVETIKEMLHTFFILHFFHNTGMPSFPDFNPNPSCFLHIFWTKQVSNRVIASFTNLSATHSWVGGVPRCCIHLDVFNHNRSSVPLRSWVLSVVFGLCSCCCLAVCVSSAKSNECALLALICIG